jgi:hypothetical protein
MWQSVKSIFKNTHFLDSPNNVATHKLYAVLSSFKICDNNTNIMFLDTIHRPVYIFKHNVSETRFYIRLPVKPIQLGPIARDSPYLRTPVPAPRWGIHAKHNTNHLRELRQNVKILKTLNVWGLTPENTISMKTGELKFSVWYQHQNNKISHSICTGRSYNSFSAAIMRVQMGEVSKLGWLIGWSTRDMLLLLCIPWMCTY